jgi:hypothetical protein
VSEPGGWVARRHPNQKRYQASTACIDFLDSYQKNNLEEIHLSRFT